MKDKTKALTALRCKEWWEDLKNYESVFPSPETTTWGEELWHSSSCSFLPPPHSDFIPA